MNLIEIHVDNGDTWRVEGSSAIRKGDLINVRGVDYEVTRVDYSLDNATSIVDRTLRQNVYLKRVK